MTGRARFLKKNLWKPEFGPKLVSKLYFCHFLEFGSLFFLGFAYNDGLQQCITSGTDKIYKKKEKFGPTFGPKRAKIRPKTRFFGHFLKFDSLVYLEVAYNDSLQQFLTSSRDKTRKIFFLDTNLGQRGQDQALLCNL